MTEGIWLLLGFLLGGGVAWVIQALRLNQVVGCSPDEVKQWRARLSELEKANAGLAATLRGRDEATASLRSEFVETKARLDEYQKGYAGLQQEKKGLQEQLQTERERIRELNEQLKAEFQNLANEILHKTTERFTKTNQERLAGILNPLQDRIKEFQGRIEEGQQQGLRFHSELKAQFENLKSMNTQLAEEARQLSTALRGENKTAGNWGEMILERILQLSGLEEGRDYDSQASERNEDGEMIRPDVIVHYPEQKGALIIDSKVSLAAYTDFFNANEERAREAAATRHLASVKAHIDGIAGKKYDTAQGLLTPDFILVFLPIEGALTLALQQDPGLYDHAFRKNIILITPSTLLATLKLVKNLWKQDDQNKNALNIANEAGSLYDKFVVFYETLEEIEKNLDRSKEGFSKAKNQLKTGRGNLLGRIEKLKLLGANTKKSMDSHLIESALSLED